MQSNAVGVREPRLAAGRNVPSAPGPLRRVRRVLGIAALAALVPALVSFLAMLARPSNSSFGIRAVEWVRENGAAGVVTHIESIYYSLEAPSKGGPALRTLPRVGVASAGGAGHAVSIDRPPRIRPLTRPALPGEGVWHPTRAHESRSDPPLLVTTFRSDPAEYPQLVAGVAWINTSRTSIVLYAGLQEPSVELPSRGPTEVPPSARGRLLATFNSGFKLEDSHGGWALHGHAYAPMRDGQATFVRYADGRYDVIDWHGGPQVPPDVVFARQNLPLIVDEGRLNPNLSDGPEWGATLGNAIEVWRSGVGVDRHGNLIYAAADYQTVRSLAEILRRAGAVRAMELDINSYWISFNTYGAPGGREPAKLLQETERPAERYLTPDDRDFFAVYAR
ncbi:MAG TPA: phosphodiester glycosidase family protein [Solirubrobacteraceae bacterium]|nr:phosphodiester glycosidase family protein [Solirubrobacteraceae bacterium]